MLENFLSRVRRNHGLEHATIHLLSDKHTGFSAQGNSTHRGFYLNIYGNIKDDDVVSAVHEAHRRMRNGEHELAVHPNCGTVLLTTATLATLAGQFVFALEQRRQKRQRVTGGVLINALPSAILASVVALIVSRPLGLALQEKYTTEGDLGALEIKEINRIPPSAVTRIFQILLGQQSHIAVQAYEVVTVG